jgi:predicted O-methyltransferase YrrM
MFDRLWSRLRARRVAAVDEIVRARLDARFEQHEAWLRSRLDQILDEQNDADRRSRRDIVQAAERDAARSSARFADEHLAGATAYFDKTATLRHGLEAAPKEGMALEFGVYSGSTLRVIAEERAGEVYGFDSFEGLPENWRSGFGAGTFAVDALPDVPGAELVVGWFDDTLPGFLAEHPGPIALLHVDGDLYSSAVTVFEHCGPRLVAGSVVVFDEYFNFPGWERHEHRAWQEYVERTGTRFTWLAYTADDEQVVVRIDEPGTDAGRR